jgi:hypothetical protein
MSITIMNLEAGVGKKTMKKAMKNLTRSVTG